MKLVSYFHLFLFTTIFTFKGDPLDFKDRVRTCVVSVHNLDVAVDSLSLTDLAKRSMEPLNSANVTSLFASIAAPEEIYGKFLTL